MNWNEKEPVILKNWKIKSVIDEYLAPELRRIWVSGAVYNHKKHSDGKRISTSFIIDADGTKVLTSSGSVYQLEGDPHPEYAKWLEENYPNFDPNNPIKIIKK